MNLFTIWDRFASWVMRAGMPVVCAYQLLSSDIFFTTQAADAVGLEKISNELLMPVHYLIAGRTARRSTLTLQERNAPHEVYYKLSQTFDYNDENFWLKTAAAVVAMPASVQVGGLMKLFSFFSPQVRERHRAIVASERSFYVSSNMDYYRMLGIPVKNLEQGEPWEPQGYKRRLGDEQHLTPEKLALSAVIRLLEENGIPCWVDCGTCLGAYRYGGVIPWDWDVDLAILEPDFDNARHALRALDPSKYLVQDWSGRTKPGSYLKVYIKETGTLVDIYHFRINPEERTVSSILSNGDNCFMTEGWKIREKRFTVATPYEHLFPVRRSPFDAIEVPLPNMPMEYLQARYGENLDPAKLFNEATLSWENDPSHPYWQRPHAR